MSTDKIDLYQRFYGPQNKFIETEQNYKIRGEYVQTNTYTLESTDDPDKYIQQIHLCHEKMDLTTYHSRGVKSKSNRDIPQVEKFPTGIGFCNFRMQGDTSQIESIVISLGGSQTTEIFPSIFHNTDFFTDFKDETSVFPNLELHAIEIIVTFNCKGKVDIMVDIMKTTNFDGRSIIILHNVMQRGDYGNPSIFPKGLNTMRINLNHPITKLFIISPIPFDKQAYIALDEIIIPFSEFIQDRNNACMYTLTFETSVNFSRIDNSKFVFYCDQDYLKNDVCIFANSIQGLRILSEMVGLAFSK